MGMIYQWKEGSHTRLEAQIVGEELERIRIRQNGRIISEDVLREARDEASPLHPAFEWNDAHAAEAYRLEQARYLIRSIDVVVERPNEEPASVRAFVSVERDSDRAYTSTAHALADDDLRRQVIGQAWRELEAWRKRHAELIEFGKLFTEIDQARIAFE